MVIGQTEAEFGISLAERFVTYTTLEAVMIPLIPHISINSFNDPVYVKLRYGVSIHVDLRLE